MPLTREQKGKIIAELEDKFKGAGSVIFADFTGLTVAKTKELRRKINGLGGALKVAKKTLIRRAVKNPAAGGIVGQESKTPVSIIFGKDDITELAKSVYYFAKTESLMILGGNLWVKILTAEDVIAFAKLPQRSQLLSMLARAIQSPIGNLASVLQANLRNLVCALDAIKNNKRAS